MITNAAELAQAIIDDPGHVADCMQRIGRFGGQHETSTVLSHSVDVWWRLHDIRQVRRVTFFGLIHDCHELITGDATRGHTGMKMKAKQNDIDKELRALLGIDLTESEFDLIHKVDMASGEDEHAHGAAVKYWCRHYLEQKVRFVHLCNEWTNR